MHSRRSSPAPARADKASGRAGDTARGIPRWAVITIVAVGLVLIGAVIWTASTFLANWLRQLTATPPGVGTVIIAPEESKAYRALPDIPEGTDAHAATTYLAQQPTAYWITPEVDPIEDVAARTQNLLAEARNAGRPLAIVIYGLPERDCSAGLSGGGLYDDAQYDEWTTIIGNVLRTAPDVQKIVILEPDSLALAPECGNVQERTNQLREAIGRLDSTNTWIYVDGGHSTWLSIDMMASLINGLGMNDVIRGFATNVSNYNDTVYEFDYSHRLSEATGGLNALIDTSRNGAGSNGEWCNPPGRLIGAPGGTYGDDVVDTNLWIKPPGESDGTCNGGPVAGAWWPEAAVELTRNVVLPTE